MVSAVADDGRVMTGEVVPDDDDALGVEPERDGALDGVAGTVARFADAGGVLGVMEPPSLPSEPRPTIARVRTVSQTAS